MKLRALFFTGVAVAVLAGCGSSPPSDERLYEKPVHLTDGRVVVCVVYKDGYKGGVSCDWENAG